MDREVAVVLELELLLLLTRQRHRLVCTFLRVHLSSGNLLRLQAFLISTAAWRLSALALSDGVFLRFFELAAIHVLGCVGRPENKLSAVKKIRQLGRVSQTWAE